MRNPILERKIIPVTHPTDNQKAVLAKIIAAATPQLAAADISDTPNLAAARDMLDQMGMITLDNEGAHLTDDGNQMMIDQNLSTPDGQLTDDGQTAAYGDEAEDAAEPETSPDLELGMDFDGEGGEDEFDFGGEGGDEEVDFGDENDSGEGKLDIDVRDDDKYHEPKEGFSLLSSLRENAARSKFQHVPEELMKNLSMDEIQQLSAVIDGGAPIYKFRSLYQKAYEHFVSEMPYGTAKGRSGDPDEWLHSRLTGDEPSTHEDEVGAAEARWDASRGH
ncbi:hypothetical protein LCGC14_1058250 [marine sediment metagenome]|uniref:Uncharacterized protein n=2 Tax=marine sediment metagenome TaxID=412755 RepID=A0A0F9MRI7_9ZZZZ